MEIDIIFPLGHIKGTRSSPESDLMTDGAYDSNDYTSVYDTRRRLMEEQTITFGFI